MQDVKDKEDSTSTRLPEDNTRIVKESSTANITVAGLSSKYNFIQMYDGAGNKKLQNVAGSIKDGTINKKNSEIGIEQLNIIGQQTIAIYAFKKTLEIRRREDQQQSEPY